MQVFNLLAQQEFDPERHVEKILGTAGEGDVTVACWGPGQISPIIVIQVQRRSISASRAEAQ